MSHLGRGQRWALAITTISLLSACATSSKDITATYVSPSLYQSYDCQQLNAESQRLQGRFVELGGRLDQAASNDKALTGVGVILFWPALFALGGTKQQEAEYARLRGEHDAVQQVVIQKHCDAPPSAVVAMPVNQTAAVSAVAPQSVASAASAAP